MAVFDKALRVLKEMIMAEDDPIARWEGTRPQKSAVRICVTFHDFLNKILGIWIFYLWETLELERNQMNCSGLFELEVWFFNLFKFFWKVKNYFSYRVLVKMIQISYLRICYLQLQSVIHLVLKLGMKLAPHFLIAILAVLIAVTRFINRKTLLYASKKTATLIRTIESSSQSAIASKEREGNVLFKLRWENRSRRESVALRLYVWHANRKIYIIH